MMEKKTTFPKTGHRSYLNLRLNSRGLTLVEALAASAIMGVGLLGLGTSLNIVGQTRAKTAVVNAAISLQARLTEAISETENYPDDPTFRARVLAGDATAIATLNVEVVPGTTVPFSRNAPVYFRRDLSTCGGFNGDPDCVLEAIIDFRNGTPVRGAYRIAINPESNVVMAPFGAMALPFVASDYKHAVPTLSSKSENVQGCDPATDLAIMGVNRDTGQVTGCVKKPDPTAACPDGQLAKGFVMNASNQLVLDCSVGLGVTPRRATCTDIYGVRTIPDPRMFDPNYSSGFSNPSCVWIAQASENVARPAGLPMNPLNTRLCPRPSGWVTAAYSHAKNCVLSLDAPGTGMGCSIAGCSASLQAFTAVNQPTLVIGGALPDSVNCSVTPTITTPENIGWESCAGSSNATWAGKVDLNPGIVQCTLIPLEVLDGAWN